LMEKELDEISAVEEDKQNIIKLIAFSDKKGMNGDILMIIYNKIVSSEGIIKYNNIMRDLGNSSQLESIAMIISA